MLKQVVKLSLERRILWLMIALAVCIYGVIAATALPVDVLPDLNRPTVAILTEAPGLAPEEVEARITAPIENAVSGSMGVERVRSVSGIGLSVVHVEFGWDTAVLVNRQTVQERLNTIRSGEGGLPEGAVPQMGPVSSIMGEVMLIGLGPAPDGSGNASRATPIELRSLADWTLRPALLSVPGVAQVTVIGGEVRQFQVRADPERLRLYGLTLGELEEAVREANLASGGGFVYGSGGGTEIVVRNVGRIQSTDELGAALVATRIGEDHAVAVRVRDVARVVEGAAINKRGDASVMAAPGVIISISKQPGADTRAVTRAIDSRLQALTAGLPAGVSINADLFRQSHFIESAITNVVHALRDGSILVVIVLAMFLLNFRVTVITLTAIPLSLLATAIIFKLLGQSINTMTLGGIAVAIGELVDDAIVGVENVHRRLKQRRSAGDVRRTLRVVEAATNEVRGPILIGTAIVMLVFLPLFFLPDLSGKLFTPLAWAYIVSIFASMVVSLTVTPVLAYYLLGGSRADPGRRASAREGSESAVLRACKAVAQRAYAVSLPRSRGVVLGALAAVAAAAIVAGRLGSEFLPPFNEGTAVVTLSLASGTSLEESNRIGAAAERLLLEVPEVKSVARRTGRAEQDEHALGVETSEIEVDFFRLSEAEPRGPRSQHDGGTGRTAPKHVRSREVVFSDMRARLSQLPSVGLSIGQPISHRIEHMESGVQAQVAVKVAGPELSILGELASKVHAAMSQIDGVVDVQTEAQVLVPQVIIRVDADRAARYGFKVGELVRTLETALGGRVVSKVLDGIRSYDLVVMLDDPWVGGRGGNGEQVTAPSGAGGGGVGGVGALANVRLVSPSGAVAVVSDVAEIRERFSPNQIVRENGTRRIVVSCNIEGRDLGAAVRSIEREIRERVPVPDRGGYTISVEGQFEAHRRATLVMFGLGALSLVLIFTTLASSFRSGVIAGQIMLNVPFAFIGAVAALWITGEPFSLASLIGFISLCGIAVRNGVLMLSHYIHLAVEEGMEFGRDLVVRGSQERVAPVLMTALTTALGLSPLVISGQTPGKEILYPVAVVVLGGLVTCTLLDFIVTPAVFLRYGRGAVERMRARRAAEAPMGLSAKDVVERTDQ